MNVNIMCLKRSLRKILSIIVLLVICTSWFSLSIPAANAKDMSNVTVDNVKTLLFIMGESISSFEPSMIVSTSFKPSQYDLRIEELIEYAKEVDPFTGNLLHKVKWTVSPSGNQYKVNFEFSYYISEEQYKELQQFAIDFAADIEGLSEYEKIKQTHDYLAQNCIYDINMDGPYNCIFNRRSNCNGYALAFYLIMQKCGIECNYITGYDHAWNAVKLGQFWYNIDVTWDDTNDVLSYDYFLKGRSDWEGHDRDTATAGYEYNYYNELDNIVSTIFYWLKWPMIVLVISFSKSLRKRR